MRLRQRQSANVGVGDLLNEAVNEFHSVARANSAAHIRLQMAHGGTNAAVSFRITHGKKMLTALAAFAPDHSERSVSKAAFAVEAGVNLKF
jgi:CelD/BcsL family acetyltransferase involved in cellulose biosynthesis